MNIKLSDNFTYSRLLRFVSAPIFMMIFTSIYSVVDGFFVSNFAGKDPFVAVNLIFPVIMVLGAFGFMFGAGGTAIVSKTLGEGNSKRANEIFTLVVAATFVLGVVLAVGFVFLMRPIAVLIGGKGDVLEYAVTYSQILMCSAPFFMLQNLFQSFFITAEKPKLGFAFTVASGVTNMVFDALFVAVLKWGIVGAAAATALSQAVGGVAPVIYFARPNTSLLRFVKTKWYGKELFNSCYNGASELLGNIAMSLVSILYNWQLMRLSGNDGVAAYGVVMYVSFVFVAIFIGYCLGVAPVIGYNFGARNKRELQNIFTKSIVVLAVTGVAMFGLCMALADVVAMVFVRDYGAEVIYLTTRSLRLYAISFLFCGFNMFCSSMFTALNNGLISAIVSFGRTLVFQLLCIFVLPLFWNLDGIWLATAVAEFLSLVLSVIMFAANNRRYGYVRVKSLSDTN